MNIDEVYDGLLAEGPAWLWFATDLRHGDMYHAASFAPAFRARYGYDLPIHLIVDGETPAAVARIFEEAFTSIRITPGLVLTDHDWRAFFLRRGLPWFGVGVPLVLHPDRNPRFSGMNRFCSENRLIWGQLYKGALQLAPDVEPAAPRVKADRERQARELLAEHAMPPGRSVVLFPYAQSLPVEARQHFAALVPALAAQGWTAFTSVAPGEHAVEGAPPVFIPFDLLPDVAEAAGWIVAVRSGIADIVSSVRCRKTVIYRRSQEIGVWGLDALELAHDALEIGVVFEVEPVTRFVDRVLALQGERPDLALRRLSEEIGATPQGADVRTYRPGDAIETPPAVRKRRFAGKVAAPDAGRLTGLSARSHPRLGGDTQGAVERLVAAWPGGRYYACRDDARVFDYLEEVDAGSLRAGRYAAAAYWHTVVATGDEGLGRLMPPRLLGKISGRDVFELGHFQSVGKAFLSPAHLASTNAERPIDLAGLKLVSGWSDLEPWGVWSTGDHSVLKFSVAEPTTAPITLELEALLGVTQAGGVLTVTAEVNGRELLTYETAATGAVALRITIPPKLMTGATAVVELHHPGARSPAMLDSTSHDDRRIAMGLTSANLRHGS